jgi:DNA mismatch repair ATPase MutL
MPVCINLLLLLYLTPSDFTKVGGSGQYLSVDGRPLSSARGTPKDIVRLFKSYIRSASKASGYLALSDPFLCLQITCPKGSYDANVEPSKDDVLFAERDDLVALSEGLFKEIYGDLDKEVRGVNESVAPVTDFSLLMRKPAVQPPMSPPATNPRVSGTRDIPWTTITAQSSAAIQLQERAGSSEMESDAMEPERSNMNPWTIAKTHFFHRPSNSDRTNHLFTPIRHDQGKISKDMRVEITQSSPSTVPSPDSHASSPEQRRGSRSSSTSESAESRQRLRVYTKGSRERDRERYGNGSLDTWFTKQNQPILSGTSRTEQSDQDGAESVMLDDLDTDDIFELPSKIINKPFKPPLSAGGRSSKAPELFSTQLSTPDEVPSDTETHERRQEFPVMEEWSSRLHRPSPGLSQIQSQISDNQETELALDFERRKREATLARRKQLQNGQLSLTPASSQSKSPHQNRYLAARAALSTSTQKQSQIDLLPTGNKSSLNREAPLADSDPRAYLMRVNSELEKDRSTSGEPRKAKRTLTNRLPFEKIPDGCDNHSLALHLCLPSGPGLSQVCRSITAVDTYASSGKELGTFTQQETPNLAETCKAWEDKISRLVKEKYRLHDVDLYGAEGGSDEACLGDIDIYAAIQASSFSNM